jgi:hypothetical protein
VENHRRITGLIVAGLHLLLMAVIGYKYRVIGRYGVKTGFSNFATIARQIQNGTFPIDSQRSPST